MKLQATASNCKWLFARAWNTNGFVIYSVSATETSRQGSGQGSIFSKYFARPEIRRFDDDAAQCSSLCEMGIISLETNQKYITVKIKFMDRY